MKAISFATVLTLAWLLTGCVGVPRASDDTTVFLLEAHFAPAPAAPGGPSVLVSPPRGGPGFDTTAMAYGRRAHEIEYFARHRWVAPPAQMLAPLLVQALEASGRFSAVVTPPAIARPRWRLDTELLTLRQDFSAVPSRMALVLRAQLTDLGAPQSVVARTFAVSVPAPTDDPRGGAQAARRAVESLLPEVAAWVAAASGAPAAR